MQYIQRVRHGIKPIDKIKIYDNYRAIVKIMILEKDRMIIIYI